jgi:HB1, ASXL, restriction endonuclease HTH domain
MSKSKKTQKPQKSSRPKAASDPAKKPSALDAAVRVLSESGTPMSCRELIEAMAAKGYWSSPKGKTPAATLYSALLREITTKGDSSRFKKSDRGQFTLA